VPSGGRGTRVGRRLGAGAARQVALCHLLLLAALVLAADARAQAERPSGGAEALAQRPAESPRPAGEIYGADCAWCHGGGGQGSARGPGLRGVGAASAHFWLSTGRMPIDEPRVATRGEPAYSDDEIDDLVALVAGFGPGPAVPEVDVDEADVVRGGELYRIHCAACHGFSGWGGALVFRRDPVSLYPTTAVQVVEAMIVDLPGMPLFGDETFDDDERRDIAAYVTEVLQEADTDRGGHALGGTGRVSEGLVAWLVGFAVLALVAWLLGERRPPKEGG
jgi:ubiquinol-cytochrome c reductase cytochrome c subunit